MNELTALVKTVNKKHFKKDATDLINLDFEGFKFFIVQLAYLILSRPPKDMNHFPLVIKMRELVSMFKDTKKNDFDPDHENDEKVKEINKQLEIDPTYPIPPGYTKFKD